MIKPPRLRRGDRIAIVAPAGAADDAAHLERACGRMREIGFEPVLGRNSQKVYGYLAGTDEERAEDANWAFRDDSIRGIFWLRGGYGAMRILERLDFEQLRRTPKVTCGFSDITALHLAIVRRAGVMAFHGGCAESSWSEFQRESLPVFMEARAFGAVRTAPADFPERAVYVPGTAIGRLIGGNLTLVASLAGTPYGAELEGKIVVLEDIGEDPYRVDRMLTQLILTGGLRKAAGVIFGDFRPRRLAEWETATPSDPERDFTLEQVLADRMREAGVPSYRGLSFGHQANNHVLPLGAMAEMDAEGMTLRITESAVV